MNYLSKHFRIKFILACMTSFKGENEGKLLDMTYFNPYYL